MMSNSRRSPHAQNAGRRSSPPAAPKRRGDRPASPRERVVAAVVAMSIFVGVAALAWRAFSTARDESAAADAPPALTASTYSLWVSSGRIPPGPVELVAVLINHEGVEATFGVHAKVDRWDGSEWVPYGELVMCMDHWHCTAHIQSPGEVDAVPALGLTAQLGRPGPVERFTTDGLEPGWYRISQGSNERIVAATILEITEGVSAPAPLVAVDAPAISVTPAVVSADRAEVQRPRVTATHLDLEESGD